MILINNYGEGVILPNIQRRGLRSRLDLEDDGDDKFFTNSVKVMNMDLVMTT